MKTEDTIINEAIEERRPKKFIKAPKFRIQPYRQLVQYAFLLTTLAIGVQFYLWVAQLEKGIVPTIIRPPGVEAFLPVSSLISLKYWALTGIINTIHPSGLVILLLILVTGLVLKKAFCSWVCPFSLVSEYLAKIHKIIFRKTKSLPVWLDYPLRSIKYLLLFFFARAIFVVMDVLSLEKFIYSPYNKVADIKMLKFFTDMSELTFWVLLILIVLSTLIPYFWCRYLCPYGALIGFTSLFSVFKINRNEASCIDCAKCAKVCPARLQVDKVKTVFSDECHACLRCVDVCPVKDTLYISAGNSPRKSKIQRKMFAAAVIGLFLIGSLTANLLGYWQNGISDEEYLQHIKHLDDPNYYHNRGEVPDYENHPIPDYNQRDIPVLQGLVAEMLL